MVEFDQSLLKKLYIPSKNSHKGQNGKLLIIAGSQLFHAASLWPLTVASRIVDMVFYCSVSQNNQLVLKAKEEFRNGIVVPRNKLNKYIEESDCVLIGPGLPRKKGQEEGDDDTKELTEKLLTSFADKQWVIDGGSLQTIEPALIPKNAILTPHVKEFEKLFENELRIMNQELSKKRDHNSKFIINDSIVWEMAKKYDCIIVIKGSVDFVCSSSDCIEVRGGNQGLTKGGTGDVLSGLIASFACKNDPFLAACAGSYINKKAAESLYNKMGFYFNASDLAGEIPITMKKLLLDS